MKALQSVLLCTTLAVMALLGGGSGASQALSSDTELAYFRVAAVTAEGIALEWATASEAGSLAFRIYRATEPGGYRAVVFETPATGGPGLPATYTFVDKDVETGTYWYWVADVNAQGVEQALTTVLAADYGLGGQELPVPAGWRYYLPMLEKNE